MDRLMTPAVVAGRQPGTEGSPVFHLLFANDGGSPPATLWHEWADVASVLGFLIGIILGIISIGISIWGFTRTH
jgi:hypothetical protein